MSDGIALVAELTAGEIPNILRSLGWTPRTLDEHTWRCTQKTSAGNVRIVVRHAGTWLYLVVMPFLEPETIKPWGLGKYPPRFLGRILAVNHNLVLVKFALDEEGDITLRVELPTESLQRREVETTAMLLLQTTEQYRGPIRDALISAGEAVTPPTEPGAQRPTVSVGDEFGQPASEPATVPPPENTDDKRAADKPTLPPPPEAPPVESAEPAESAAPAPSSAAAPLPEPAPDLTPPATPAPAASAIATTPGAATVPDAPAETPAAKPAVAVSSESNKPD